MGKAEAVKALRPEMKSLGFAFRDNMFQFKETLDQPLHFIVYIQKNLHSDTYKIGLSILIRSPLLNESKWRAFLSAHLLCDGVRFHAPSEIWWPSARLAQAGAALSRYAIPWFEKWRSPELLLEKLEKSIDERRSLIEVVEPPSREQEEVLNRIWPRVVAGSPWVPVTSYFAASILYYLLGNKQMSIRRTEDWLNRLSPTDRAEMAEAQEQLLVLKRYHAG